MNKSLKTILQKTIDKNRSNWHIMLYPTLWAYRTSVKTATNFTPFQLVYGLESIFPIECEILSLKLAVELLLERVKTQYDKAIRPRVFLKATLSWSMTKTKTPWGQANSSLCDMVPLSQASFWERGL